MVRKRSAAEGSSKIEENNQCKEPPDEAFEAPPFVLELKVFADRDLVVDSADVVCFDGRGKATSGTMSLLDSMGAWSCYCSSASMTLISPLRSRTAN